MKFLKISGELVYFLFDSTTLFLVGIALIAGLVGFAIARKKGYFESGG